MISEHATEWLGYPVKLFDMAEAGDETIDCANTIYRLALEWDSEQDFPTLFSAFLAQRNVAETPAIIIGKYFDEDPDAGSEEVVQALVSARTKLPFLRGIFLGDMISEECEVSWIVHSDVSPLLTAFPRLEHLRLRGTGQLSLGGRLAHEHLQTLTIETGGLPVQLLEEVLSSRLPALESLELWLGTENYGGDVSAADLAPLLAGGCFPNLKHLGLRNSEIVDGIATALASSPLLARLHSLDLSLGTLSDSGGKALLENPALKRLSKLDLHRHYLSKDMMVALQRAFPIVNVAEPQGNATRSGDRYVAVSE